MYEKRTRSQPPRKTREPKTKAEDSGVVSLTVPYSRSERFFKQRLHASLNPRQGRALRAVFDGMYQEGAIDSGGREVDSQEAALRLLLDQIADGMGYPRKPSDPRPVL